MPAMAYAGAAHAPQAADTATSLDSPAQPGSVAPTTSSTDSLSSPTTESAAPEARSASPTGPRITDEIESAAADGEEITVLVKLKSAERSALAAADSDEGRIEALQTHAERSQAPLVEYADTTAGVKHVESLWITNVVALEVDFSEVSLRELAGQPHVEALHPNYEIEPVTPVRRSTLPDPYADFGCQPFDAEPECDPDEQWKGIDNRDLEQFGHGFNITWPLAELNATHAWDEGNMGEGARVASIDTGTDVRHPDIELYTEDPEDPTYPGGHARFSGPINYDHLPTGTRIADALPIPGQALSEQNTTHPINETANGHGLASSSIIGGGNASGIHIGMAPEAELLVGDVDEVFWLAEAAAIQWAVRQDADVIHVNFGSGSDGTSTLAREIFRNAAHSGTLTVVPIGNSGEGTTNTRDQPQTLSVGATTGANNVTGFSAGMHRDSSEAHAYPWWPEEWTSPDVAAPGLRGLSAQQIGKEEYKEIGPNGMWNWFGGTSMANPYVAGAAALVEGSVEEDLHPHTIRSVLISTARKDPHNPLPVSGYDPNPGEKDVQPTRMGAGIPDVNAATELVTSETGITGTVYWRGTDEPNIDTPVVDAYIRTEEGAPRAPAEFITGPDGEFTIPLPPGEHELVIDAYGYETKTITVEVSEDGSWDQRDIELDRIADVSHVTEPPEQVDPGMSLLGAGDGMAYSTEMNLANVQEVDIELTDDSTVDPDSVTVLLNNEQYEIGDTVTFGVGEPIDLTPATVTAIPDAGTGGETIGLELTVRSHGSFGNTEHETVVRPGTAEIASPIRIAEGEAFPGVMNDGEVASMRLVADNLQELEIGLHENSTLGADDLQLLVNGQETAFGERLGEDAVGEAPMTSIPDDLVIGPAEAATDPTLTSEPDTFGAQPALGVTVRHGGGLAAGESTTAIVHVHEAGTHAPVSGATVTVSGAGIDETATTGEDGTVELELAPDEAGEITITAEGDGVTAERTIEAAAEVPGVIEVPGDFDSLAAAVDAASDGAVIRLGDGEYEGPIEVTNSIEIRAALGADPTIVAEEADRAVTVAASDVTIEGVTIQSPDGDGVFLDEPAAGVLLENVAIEAATDGIEAIHSENHTIRGSTIEAERNGIVGTHGHNLTVTDNHIHGFDARGTFLGGGAPTEDGGFFAGVEDMEISNNYVAGADTSETSGIQLGRSSDGTEVTNNVIEDVNGIGVRLDFANNNIDVNHNSITNVQTGFSEHFTESQFTNNHVVDVHTLFESTAHNANDADAYRPIGVTHNVFQGFEVAFDLGDADAGFTLNAQENLFLIQDSAIIQVEPDNGTQGTFALEITGVAGPTTDEVSLATDTVEVISLENPVLRVPQTFDSIEAALEAAPEGGTIVVDEGTYEAHLELNQSVTIQAAPGADVTLVDPREEADGSPQITVSASDVTLDRVDLEPADGAVGVFLADGAVNATVSDLHIEPADGTLAAGVEVVFADDPTLEGLSIAGVTNGIIGTHGEGLTVTDTRITDFQEHGMYIGGGAPTSEEGFFAGLSDMEITRNHVDGGETGTHGIRLGRSTADSVVANNTVRSVDRFGLRVDFNSAGVVFDQNTVEDAGGGLSEHFSEVEFTRNHVRDVDSAFVSTAHNAQDSDSYRPISVTGNHFEDFDAAFEFAEGEVAEGFELPAEGNYYVLDGEPLDGIDADEHVVGPATVDWEPLLTEAPDDAGARAAIRAVVESSVPLEPGRPATMVVTVHEAGTHAPVSGATVTVSGAGVDETATTGDDGTVELEVTPSSRGELTVTSEADAGTDSDTLTVGSPAEAAFEVSELTPQDVTVGQGEVIDVSANVTNTGDAEATKTVEFRVGGTTVASREVTLAGGESTTVTFEGIDTSDLELGEFTHGVFTEDDERTATLTVAEPAFFEVSGLDPTEATIVQGEQLTVEATVENTGGVEATQTIELRIGGAELTVASEDVTLGPGESTTLTFAVDGETTADLEAGEFPHGVYSADDEDTSGTLTVQAAVATFEVSELDPTDATVEAGESVDVTVLVSNTGGVEGTQTVELTIDGDVVATEEVTIAAGESATVSFDDVDTSDLSEGEYTHTVSTDDDEASGALTIQAAADGTGDGPGNGTDDGTDDGSTDEGIPGFGLVAGLVALLAASLLALRGRE